VGWAEGLVPLPYFGLCVGVISLHYLSNGFDHPRILLIDGVKETPNVASVNEIMKKKMISQKFHNIITRSGSCFGTNTIIRLM